MSDIISGSFLETSIMKTIMEVMDTPFIYLARHIHKGQTKLEEQTAL